MKKLRNGLIVFSVLTATLCLVALSPQGAAALVSTNVADFGQNTVGSSSTIPITLTNNEPFPLLVNLKLNDPTGPFSINSPLVSIGPAAAVTVTVTFLPTEVGTYSNTLVIECMPGPTEQVVLKGEGVLEVKTMGTEDPVDLLAYFDDAVTSGDLMGNGPGKSDDGRLNALRNMLIQAISLAERGEVESARGQFLVVLKKLQDKEKGKSQPFVTGVAVPEFIEKIQQKMESLGQQP